MSGIVGPGDEKTYAGSRGSPKEDDYQPMAVYNYDIEEEMEEEDVQGALAKSVQKGGRFFQRARLHLKRYMLELRRWYRMWRLRSLKNIKAYPSNISLQNYEREQADARCTHAERYCVLYIFWGLCRGLTVGYLMRSIFSFAISLFSQKFFSRPRELLRRSFFHYDSVQFSIFLGIMGFVYRLLQCVFCKLRGGPGKLNSAVAAFIAGSAIMLDKPERRSTISLYLLVRGTYELARTFDFHGMIALPDYISPVLFALCQVPIMYSFLRYPSALARSYHKFILKMGNVTPQAVESIAGYSVEYAPCSPVFHEGGCVRYNFTDWLHGIVFRALPIYLPVHIVPALIFKRKHVVKSPLVFALDTVVAIGRSCLFLSTYQAIVKSTMCFSRWLLQRNSDFACVLAGWFTGAALFFEHPHRHNELVMYVMPRALETAVNLYKHLVPSWVTYVFDAGYAHALMFMVAVSMFVFAADTPPKLKSLNATIFRIIFGSGTRMIPGSVSMRYRRAGGGSSGTVTPVRAPSPYSPRPSPLRQQRGKGGVVLDDLHPRATSPGSLPTPPILWGGAPSLVSQGHGGTLRSSPEHTTVPGHGTGAVERGRLQSFSVHAQSAADKDSSRM